MDQDFHYYGTYFAATLGRYDVYEASLIAKASNFIDFLSNERYAGYWHIVTNDEKSSHYNVIAKIDYPRYTFQGTLSTGASGSRGLWSSFHFPPGNYSDPPGTPTKIDVHGEELAKLLPDHQIRGIDRNINSDTGKLLNRPLSALSRTLIQDTIRCLTDLSRLEAILARAAGGEALLQPQNKERILRRFGLLLLGIRAHVVADTWAHQDWCGVNHAINTYWDLENDWLDNVVGTQDIEYQDIDQTWKKVTLKAYNAVSDRIGNENLAAAPPAACIGHGWMGHLPDYSFIKYRYKPYWRPKDAPPLERDNPTEYRYAFLELCSLFFQTNGFKFQPNDSEWFLEAAQRAISSPVEIVNKENCPRVYSSNKWTQEMHMVKVPPGYFIETPLPIPIDSKKEPDELAVLSGEVDYHKATLDLLGMTRYGTFFIHYASDLYLFQIAADYHFHFVKNWIKTHRIGPSDLFEDSWSKQLGPLSERISEILV